MFRTVTRASANRSASLFRTQASRQRFLSTAPPHHQSRSWRSSAVRWGIAIGGVYYYNTSTIFAEEPPAILGQVAEDIEHRLPTLDSYSPSSRKKEQALASTQALAEAEDDTQSVEDLEEEAAGEGAFNEETGEINWDCPCLGGMAYGPCGPEFREAFSCFVYSKEDPKGMDCIEKFKGMQGCFREHPEVYQAELEDDEEYEEEQRGTTDEAVKVAASLPEDSPSVAAGVKEAETKNADKKTRQDAKAPQETSTAENTISFNPPDADEAEFKPGTSSIKRRDDASRQSSAKDGTQSISESEEESVPRASRNARD